MAELRIPSADFDTELVQGGMKAAMKEAGATSRDLLMVPIDQLKVVAGLNIRIQDDDYEAHIEEIKESIVENGFYAHKPLSGFAGKEGENTFIFVTGGFTRLEAAKRAKTEGAPLESLPVVMKPPGTSMADLTVALAIDNTGKPLKPYERGIVVKRLIGFGESEEEVARRMRISGQYVKDLLYLMGLPNGLRQQVIAGRASAGHVIQLARKVGTAEALRAFETSGGPAGEPSAPTPRETAAATARTPSVKKPIVPKKTLFSAIDYAIALPSEGIKWLARWRKGDGDAVAELAAYKPPRKNAAKPKAAKAASGKPKADKAATKDPFDIGGGKETPAPNPDPL